MFDGSMLDVAIGLIVLFLVASLMASAVVEAVGGFLRRRQKHLWDSLDLLLGNTSINDDADVGRIVEALYRQPEITGLVRPSDRWSLTRTGPERNGKGAGGTVPFQSKWSGKAKRRTSSKDQLRRRHYGPTWIESREFANALLRCVRTGATLEAQLGRLSSHIDRILAQPQLHVDVRAEVNKALGNLQVAAKGLNALDFKVGLATLHMAVAEVADEEFTSALADVEVSLTTIARGNPSETNYGSLFSVLPEDVQSKLGDIVAEAGGDFERIRSGIEAWFERHMAAASEWYRKQTRWFLFLAGAILAIALNVDAVHAATTLYRDKDARAAVVQVAEKIGETMCPAADESKSDASKRAPDKQGDATDPGGSAPATPLANVANSVAATDVSVPDNTTATAGGKEIDLDCVQKTVGGSIPLPVGWANVDYGPAAWAIRFLGWLIVAGAVTLGAPFWFDLLGRALAARRTRGTK